ncbi:MAG: site-specific integrase [Desulfobacterales bacterium]|nr:site-specific integrase [Desulfobacterales bacterium]
MSKRIKTDYPGVFYREARRVGRNGTEKVYYVVFKKDGKVHEEKAGRQYADAMTPAKANSIRAERIEGKRKSKKQIREQEKARKEAEAGKWTIGRLWNSYSSDKEENHSFITDRNRYEKYIQPVFKSREPKDIILLDVERLRRRLLKSRSPQTVKHVLSLLKRIVNYGVKRNLCEGLSFHVQVPQVNNIKTEDLTKEQLNALIKAIDEEEDIQIAHLMKMALMTGMRRGELFKLEWSDIDFNRGFINIHDPKGGRDQSIPLNEAAREILKNHPQTESPYVFPDKNGNKRKSITRQANRIKERAGLPKDFRAMHGLRHVYASMLASSGQVDMYTLQRLLTHKSPVMTQRYAHLRDETLKRASNLAGELINGKK